MKNIRTADPAPMVPNGSDLVWQSVDQRD